MKVTLKNCILSVRGFYEDITPTESTFLTGYAIVRNGVPKFSTDAYKYTTLQAEVGAKYRLKAYGSNNVIMACGIENPSVLINGQNFDGNVYGTSDGTGGWKEFTFTCNSPYLYIGISNYTEEGGTFKLEIVM